MSFLFLILGQIVSVFGSALLRFALALHVLDISGQPTIFATMLAISSLPILLAPLGGVLADRLNRRNLIVAYDVIASIGVLALYLGLGASDGGIWPDLILIGGVLMLLGLIGALDTPTVLAVLPTLVPSNKLEHANGMVNGVQALSGIAAPIVGGVLYGWLGLQTLLLCSLLLFAAAAVVECFIRLPLRRNGEKRQPLTARSVMEDLASGFRYVRTQPNLVSIMILAGLLNFVITPFFIVGAPLLLRLTLDSSDLGYGAGMSAIELAIIIGAITAGFWTARLHLTKLYRWMLVIAALFVPMAIAFAPALLAGHAITAYTMFLISAAMIAMLLTVLSIYVTSLLQKRTPDHHLGKTMAMLTMVAQCAAPVGQLLAGFLFARLSQHIYQPILLIGLLTIGIAWLAKRLFKGDAGNESASTS